MEPSGKVGLKPLVIPTTAVEPTGQPVHHNDPVWGDSDEQVSSGFFWPEVKTANDGGDGTWTKPSEIHRLKKMTFSGSRSDPGEDSYQREITKLDEKIAHTYQQFRAAPRDSTERAELANRLDALKGAKDALEDEHADVENWSQ